MYKTKKIRAASYITGAPNVSASTTVKKEGRFLTRFVRWSWIVLVISSILQLGIFWSLENALAVGIVVVAWFTLTKLFLRPEILATYTLSSFLIIGFTLTQYYFPLIFTLLEGKAVIFNMDLPYEVFLHSLAAFFIVVAGHLIYRSYSKHLEKRPSIILVKAGFFCPPTDRQLWIMGFLGLAAMYYVYFYSPSVGREVSGAGDKFIQGLIAFSYAPFFIPVGRLYGGKEVNLRRVIPMLLVFTVLLFVVSMGRNSRGAFMIGFTAIGFAWGFGLLLGVFKTRLFTFKNVLLAIIGFWFFTGPLADLATAMVIVRAQRENIDRAELVSLTLRAYNDKEAIRLYKLAGITEERDWDEQYMNNLFLARFSNLKYNDASLVEASKINETDPSIYNYTIDRLWVTLPEPALDFLGIEVDKRTVNTCSFGDYLYYKAGAGATSLGGYRTGHFAGTGMAAFGWWYLLILGLGMMPVYFLYDKLLFKRKRVTNSSSQNNGHETFFSFCGLLELTSIFMFLPAESVINPYIFLIRGFFQMLLLYFLVFHLTRLLAVLVPNFVIRRQVRRRRIISR